MSPGTPNAIGFFGVAYYEENKDKLKSIAVVNPKTGDAVSPTATTIENGTYAPFSRPLFIYVNTASFKRPEVRKFIGYYLQNAPDLASTTGYVALPASIYKEAMMRCRMGKSRHALPDPRIGKAFRAGDGNLPARQLGQLSALRSAEALWRRQR